MDFNDSTSYAVAFPPNSSVGTVQCIEISLFNDVLFELEENFIVELMTHDPALTINEETNVGILSIVDIPHPDGKIQNNKTMYVIATLLETLCLYSGCSFLYQLTV